jgi:dihydroorotase
MHHHFRDETETDRGSGMLSLTCRFAAQQFQKVVVMPNLKPPVRTVEEAMAYREKILACQQGCEAEFDPLMTLYMTDMTT